MTTERIDVLAVMRRAQRTIQSQSKTSGDGADHQADLINDACHSVMELVDFAQSALWYVDCAAEAERDRHRKNGASNSQVIAQAVADNLRAALTRVGGA